MKGNRYVYYELSNEHRLNKLEGSKRHKKSVHQEYQKSRLTMRWRLQHFAKKQNFGYVYGTQLMYIQENVRDKYNQYQENLKRYWGGGRYFKKMGRMDKVRFKESLKQKKDEESDNDNGDFLEILHKLDVKLSKWNNRFAFEAIREMKKPIRNQQYSIE